MDGPPVDLVTDYDSDSLSSVVGDQAANISLYCLLFWSRDGQLDQEIANYVSANLRLLNEQFGPRVQGFAIEDGSAADADPPADPIYDIARAYRVAVDELPCARFSTALDGGKVLKLPFKTFLPTDEKRTQDDIGAGFRAIAGAAQRSTGVMKMRRIAHLQRSLRDARGNTFGDRIEKGERVLQRVAADGEALARIAKSGKTIVAAVSSAAVIAIGTPAAVSAIGGPTDGPIASTPSPGKVSDAKQKHRGDHRLP